MLQVVQPANGGRVAVVDAPSPRLTTTNVLVRTSATLISAGTERAVTKLARSNLAEKARARPDLVRQVVRKARDEGLRPTIEAVRSRLEEDILLGYSGAGTVIEVGPATRGLRVGDRVATGGGGYASHAEFQSVPWVLASPIPDDVSDEAAAFATVASVGLHGLRQADIRVGSKVVVVGMGLIGQLTSRMATAAGCDVLGIDLDPELLALAEHHGVSGVVEQGDATTAAVLEWSRGRGADSVVITAGSPADSSVLAAVPARCRDRAVVVAVGDVGLDLDRAAFYDKELELRLARSYGPGRYDASYEEWGVDYPLGHVRWTEGRNLEAVLDLLASGRLEVSDLITHRVPIDQAASAYDLLEDRSERSIGIVLTYPGTAAATPTVEVGRPARRARATGRRPVGILGSGRFVRGVVLPSLADAGVGPVVHIASASGVTAARLAAAKGIARASSEPAAVIDDPEVEVVVVATPHSSHAELTAAALRAGKDVYCEKPLAIDRAGLDEVTAALDAGGGSLYVGFNRRYAPMVRAARHALAGAGPLTIHYRICAGPVPPGHWYGDRREGGRLHGEVCHFVDTCSALLDDAPVESVDVIGPRSDAHDSYHLLIGYADGSSASIAYTADHAPATPKERIEINGRGHTVVLDNFRSLTVDGDRVKVEAGKGHAAGLTAWSTSDQSATALATTEIMLRAADQLRSAASDG